ncbi:21977_t:CDS:1, partial [Racocetra persica]
LAQECQDLESQKNLFSKSEFTTEWKIKFDQIIRQLLNKMQNKTDTYIRPVPSHSMSNSWC